MAYSKMAFVLVPVYAGISAVFYFYACPIMWGAHTEWFRWAVTILWPGLLVVVVGLVWFFATALRWIVLKGAPEDTEYVAEQ